jgi:arylsulfatase A-like enzyme
VKQGINWLEKNSNKKFFLFLHTYETHSPFTPKEFYSKLLKTDYTGNLPEHTSKDIIRQINNGKLEITEADRLHIINTYDAEIRSMDDSFQYFLDYLKRMKLYDNSIIIFTSDHGEEFNEHGVMATHSHTLFNELLYVPLIIKLGR